jgi:putative ABC transport system ATP-binding protein
MAQEPFILCDNLVKIYNVMGHDVVALQGLDLTVSRGELLGIVGVSGSGKSTLLNILGGLDRPTAGRVWIDKKDILKMTDRSLDDYRLYQVGFLWQQSARNLIPYLTAQENVEYPMTIAGRSGKAKHQRAEKLLEIVKLTDRKHHHLSELSGGEQQRVAIAVALSNDPRLLLADEPTGEIDDQTAKIIYQIFQDLQTETGLTILIVSHDSHLAHHVDRVISIRDGKTSTETVLSFDNDADHAEGLPTQTAESGEQFGKVFKELIILDSAGRLQLPKDVIEKFNIKGRVRLEVSENGIIILPVVNEEAIQPAEVMLDQLEQTKKLGGMREFFRRMGTRGGKGHDRSP